MEVICIIFNLKLFFVIEVARSFFRFDNVELMILFESICKHSYWKLAEILGVVVYICLWPGYFLVTVGRIILCKCKRFDRDWWLHKPTEWV